MIGGDPGQPLAAEYKLRDAFQEPAEPCHRTGRAANHANTGVRGAFDHRCARRCIPVEMKHFDLVTCQRERFGKLGRQVGLPFPDRVLHRHHQNPHRAPADQYRFQTTRRT